MLVMEKGYHRLGHKVYRKPVHENMNCYLHKESNHHPGQKCAVIKTLLDQASQICEERYLQEELNHLYVALQANGYTVKEIIKAMHPRRSCHSNSSKRHVEAGKAFLQYIKGVLDRIRKLLCRHKRAVYRQT